MTTLVFKHKLRDLLIYDYNKNNCESIKRKNKYELTINNNIINTNKKIKKDNKKLSIKTISPFQCFHTKEYGSIKISKNYKRNNKHKNLNEIKIFDDMSILNTINNINKGKITSKTIEYINFSNKYKIFKRSNTYQGIKQKDSYSIEKFNQLKNEFFKLDKNFLKEISPTNKFIQINKKLNEYKKGLKERKENFYFNINFINDNRQKMEIKKLNYFNKNKYNMNCNKIIYRKVPSLIKLNTYQL